MRSHLQRARMTPLMARRVRSPLYGSCAERVDTRLTRRGFSLIAYRQSQLHERASTGHISFLWQAGDTHNEISKCMSGTVSGKHTLFRVRCALQRRLCMRLAILASQKPWTEAGCEAHMLPRG